MYKNFKVFLALVFVPAIVSGRYLPTFNIRQTRSLRDDQMFEINPRIIGGSAVEEGSLPFMVSVQNTDSQHLCSGVIVSSEWILTTALCTAKSPHSLHIAAGSANLSATPNIYEVDGITVHPSYHRRESGFDVSLLHLATPIKFNAFTRKAVLSKENYLKNGDQLLISGWGQHKLKDTKQSNVLQKLVVSYKTNSDCNKQFPQLEVQEGSFCIQAPTNSGACHGDAGSPVLDVNLRVLGLISFGIPCAQGYPDVAVSIPDKYFWIKSITKEEL